LENLFRLKKPPSLPNVFSKKEVKELITAPNNLKHKTLLMLVYSAGLRNSQKKVHLLFSLKIGLQLLITIL
jgi:integrase/recombinase XerD